MSVITNPLSLSLFTCGFGAWDASSISRIRKRSERKKKTMIKKDSLLVKKNECDAIHFELWISENAHTHCKKRRKNGVVFCPLSLFTLEKQLAFGVHAAGLSHSSASSLSYLDFLFLTESRSLSPVHVALIFNLFSFVVCVLLAFRTRTPTRAFAHEKSDCEVFGWRQKFNYMQNLRFPAQFQETRHEKERKKRRVWKSEDASSEK